ncbi:MAG: DUF134 domain-containing protein [Syntrophales bacterium]
MVRPKCCRRISGKPARKVFKPVGVPLAALQEIVLSMDEFEAIRLADLEGLYQEEAAESMNVSRQTFGRIIETARRKVAQVLTDGIALRIEGAEIEMPEKRMFKCNQCQHVWGLAYGTGRPEECPKCQARSICRVSEQEDSYGPGGKGSRRQCRRSGE